MKTARNCERCLRRAKMKWNTTAQCDKDEGICPRERGTELYSCPDLPKKKK